MIASPLFDISKRQLVIAQCRAGLVGWMPTPNARPASQLDEWLYEISETLAAPFAINQIVHRPNERLEHDWELKHKVPVVITSLAAQAMGADFAYIGSVFIATHEARSLEAQKKMVVDCNSGDIVYSSLFTGVHGNYLEPSIRNAGLAPDKLADSDPSKMSFAGGEGKRINRG